MPLPAQSSCLGAISAESAAYGALVQLSGVTRGVLTRHSRDVAGDGLHQNASPCVARALRLFAACGRDGQTSCCGSAATTTSAALRRGARSPAAGKCASSAGLSFSDDTRFAASSARRARPTRGGSSSTAIARDAHADQHDAPDGGLIRPARLPSVATALYTFLAARLPLAARRSASSRRLSDADCSPRCHSFDNVRTVYTIDGQRSVTAREQS